MTLQGLELANVLIEAILDKKGNDVLLLDVHELTVLSNYFLLCSGENDRQIKAIVDGLMEEAKKTLGILPRGKEGEPESGWVLVDFGDVLVHIFDEQRRTYYNLEELWRRAYTVVHMQ